MNTPGLERLHELEAQLRPASVATVGGFRPPEDQMTSWFFKAVARPEEGLPNWQNQPMFPLLQIRVDELPFVPEQLRETALLVVFLNPFKIPFGLPHGEGWLIREYANLTDLVPLPAVETPYRPLPIQWRKVEDDAPGWEDAWDLVDLTPVLDDEAPSDSFFMNLNRYSATKVGGFPTDIQHGAGIADFVFQIASESKVGWMWADNGVAYFHKTDGQWRFSCQFY